MHMHIQTQAGGYQQLARSARGSASTPLGDGWRSLRESRGTRLQLCRCWWLTRLCLMQLHEPRRRMGGRAQRPARFQSKAQFPPFHPAARKLLCPLCACALVLLCSCAPAFLSEASSGRGIECPSGNRILSEQWRRRCNGKCKTRKKRAASGKLPCRVYGVSCRYSVGCTLY